MKISKKRVRQILFTLLGVSILGVFLNPEILRVIVWHKPLQYDQPFGPAIANADRIVVRSDGYDCCQKISNTNTLFEITLPAEVQKVSENFKFQSVTTTNSLYEVCLCCGSYGIDWYQGERRLALTALQHGEHLRWSGFTTMRLLGFKVRYGDAPLTQESQAWINNWLEEQLAQ